jgi:hypothetical protein
VKPGFQYADFGKGKGKGKVVPVQLFKHSTMKAYWGVNV